MTITLKQMSAAALVCLASTSSIGQEYFGFKFDQNISSVKQQLSLLGITPEVDTPILFEKRPIVYDIQIKNYPIDELNEIGDLTLSFNSQKMLMSVVATMSDKFLPKFDEWNKFIKPFEITEGVYVQTLILSKSHTTEFKMGYGSKKNQVDNYGVIRARGMMAGKKTVTCSRYIFQLQHPGIIFEDSPIDDVTVGQTIKTLTGAPYTCVAPTQEELNNGAFVGVPHLHKAVAKAPAKANPETAPQASSAAPKHINAKNVF